MPNDALNRFYAAINESSLSAPISGPGPLPESTTASATAPTAAPTTAPRTPSPLGRNSVTRASTSTTMTSQHDPIQRTEKPSAATRTSQWWTRHANDRWTWELASAVLCLALLATIAGILIGYDQKPAPDLPDGITIAAVISVLSTLAKGSLLVLLAAAVRQERWLYMTSDASTLNLVDEFEEASRGIWGSIRLLTTARGSLRALLLAAVTVLAFGFEPFLQQLVALESRNVPVSDLGPASIKTPTSYDASLARVGNATGGSQLVLAASIGAYGGATGAVPQPQCATGNCTWPDYNVLAMCSVCQDVTSRVTIDGNAFSNGTNFNDIISDYAQNANSSTSQSYTYNATIRMPTGNAPSIDFPLSLSGSNPVTWDLTRPKRYTWSLNIDPTPNSYWGSAWKNESFAGIDAPLYAMGYLDMDLNEDHSRMVLKQALECALTPCVRTEHTEMHSYVLDPAVTHTDYGHIEFGQSQPDGTVTSGFRTRVNGTDFAMVDQGTGNYDGSANDFIRSLRIVLEGNSTYTRQGNFYGAGNENNFDYEATAFTQTSSPWSSIGQQAIDGSGNFTDIADGVARAVSGKLQDLQSTALNGTVLRSEIIVNVRWGWLAFPLSLVLLGVGGLVATILATRQRHLPIWKDSVLPLLLRHGPKTGGVAQYPDASGESPNDASAITREAKQEQVHLVPTRASAQQTVPVWMLESVSSEKELQPTNNEIIGMAR